MFSCWVVGNLLYLWSFSLSLLPFTLTCTCNGKMNARWACGTYIQSTLSRVPLLERPSLYLPFLYVTVNFVFSRRYLLLFSLFAIRDLSLRSAHPRSSRLFFSFFTSRKKRRRGTTAWPFEVFYGFVFRRFRMSFLSLFPSLFLAFLSSYHARIFRKIDNKIHMCMRNSFDTYLYLVAFCVYKVVSMLCDNSRRFY